MSQEIDFVPILPDASAAKIRVPQGHHGIACGQRLYAGIMYTHVTNGVALGLVQEIGSSHKVVLAHIDTGSKLEDVLKVLLTHFGTHPKGVRADIIMGKDDKGRFEKISELLTKAGVNVCALVHDGNGIDLSYDLKTGLAIFPWSLDRQPEYMPNADLAGDFAQYAGQTGADRARILPSGRAILDPCREAFDLRRINSLSPFNLTRPKPAVKAAAENKV